MRIEISLSLTPINLTTPSNTSKFLLVIMNEAMNLRLKLIRSPTPKFPLLKGRHKWERENDLPEEEYAKVK